MSNSPSSNEKPHIEIASDEDWKDRVKAEDARRDAESQMQQAETPPSETDDSMEQELDFAALPPASLLTLLQMLSTQSIVALGLIPGPNGKTTVQLPLAKHFIDLLALLETKCQGNLTADEERFLESTLHELRMAYVGQSNKTG